MDRPLTGNFKSVDLQNLYVHMCTSNSNLIPKMIMEFSSEEAVLEILPVLCPVHPVAKPQLTLPPWQKALTVLMNATANHDRQGQAAHRRYRQITHSS